MFFPISDDDRDVTTTAFVTYFLIAANVVVFLYQTYNPEFTYGWSIIPRELTTGVDLVEPVAIQTRDGVQQVPQAPGPSFIWLTMISAMFMHGGFAHILGNMLYLWIFGNNVEHRFGHSQFLLFYLASGAVGSIAQVAIEPWGVLPNLGASGAIAGVMGAYLVLFPRNKVNAVFFVTIISVPAILVLGMWAATQFMNGFGAIASTSQNVGGVAYLAHLGGLMTGVFFAFRLRKKLKHEPDSELRRQYQRDPTARRIW